jgi:putative membrane protein
MAAPQDRLNTPRRISRSVCQPTIDAEAAVYDKTMRRNTFIKNMLIAAMSACALVAACGTNSRESSSNTGPEKSSLPSPIANNTAAPAGSNTSNANYANTLTAEESFWTTAADGGLAEVEMGKLASQKAQNPDVKKFAQMMVSDHTKANNELKAIAAKQKITLPTEVGPRNRSTIDELNKLSGADFDREYVQAMVDDHEADVQLFEDQAEDETDAQAKAFAEKTLPVLRKHLEAIKAIQAKMK